MNEESIYLKAESKPKRKIETKQDVQLIQQELQEKKEQLIDDAPKISLSIKNAEFCLNILFNEDGTPKGDFRVSERYQKKFVFHLSIHIRNLLPARCTGEI